MITLLSKLFIKNSGDYRNPAVRRSYGIVGSVSGIILNILLFSGKYIAGMASGSVAIMADAFNNMSDAGSSMITLIGFKFAGRKPDTEHPFGHGRIEYISGFAVALAIIIMGVELFKTSAEKIMDPSPVDTGLLSMAILAVSICVKVYMFYYNRSIGGKIDSSAMKATAMDSLSDAAATTMVLISMLVMKFGGFNVDGWCGILVAVFILYAGYNAAKDTLSPLLGQPPDPEFIKQIRDITLAHREIVGIHDLVVHDYGPGRIMISLHGEVPGDGNIYEIHDAIDRIETELKEKLGCEAVIHMDPIAMDDKTVMDTKKEVADLVRNIDRLLTIHDFRMVQGQSHTNLIFDVVVPMKFRMSDEEVEAEIKKQVSTRWENYYVVLKVDHPYSA